MGIVALLDRRIEGVHIDMDDLADPRRLACIVHALFLAGGAPTRKVSEVDVDANGSDTIALRSRVAHRIDAAESRSLVRHAVDLDETDADFHAGRHRPASYPTVAKNGGAVLLDARRRAEERRVGKEGVN